MLETFPLKEVREAVRDALRLRAISFDAVKHLLLCALEQRPPKRIWRTITICRWPKWR